MTEERVQRSALFSFDPAELDSEDERQRFKEKNREAFQRADYTPPDAESGNKAPAKSIETKASAKTVTKTAPPAVPNFRRQRGRPAGDRRYRISFKSTEQHLATLYAIAGQGELVGAFERAVELLAREVAQTGR